jgi:hypothetical protein
MQPSDQPGDQPGDQPSTFARSRSSTASSFACSLVRITELRAESADLLDDIADGFSAKVASSGCRPRAAVEPVKIEPFRRVSIPLCLPCHAAASLRCNDINVLSDRGS